MGAAGPLQTATRTLRFGGSGSSLESSGERKQEPHEPRRASLPGDSFIFVKLNAEMSIALRVDLDANTARAAGFAAAKTTATPPPFAFGTSGVVEDSHPDDARLPHEAHPLLRCTAAVLPSLASEC